MNLYGGHNISFYIFTPFKQFNPNPNPNSDLVWLGAFLFSLLICSLFWFAVSQVGLAELVIRGRPSPSLQKMTNHCCAGTLFYESKQKP